jgi:tetratricopeptide (TPR) repeat protein
MAMSADPAAAAANVGAASVAAEETLQELPVPTEPAPIQQVAPSEVSSGVPPPPKPGQPAKPVHEVDLSDEWASLLEHGAATEAAAVAPPQPPTEAGEIAEFHIPLDAPPAKEPPPATPPPSKAAADEAEAAIEFIPVEESGKEELPPKPQIPAPQTAKAGSEIELDQEYELVLSPEPETESPEDPATIADPAKSAKLAEHALASDQFLADLANEIDQLGMDQLTPSFSEPAAKEHAPAAAAKAEVPALPGEHEPLKEVFDEFRAELGEMGAEDEDLETHYNLGIAFREMGLLEEAISEFQKVAKANEKGKAFRYAMQCCTLLGLAFMEKGQPSIAAIWYERALRTPGVDAESTLALRYDLGVAQESANDLDAALKSFSQVYAVNIDYRDVADRIAALQKTTR